MDALLLLVWIVRLLFLALLYLFLARVVRSLLRDLRAAAREPGARPAGSSSSSRRPVSRRPGRSFDLDAITTLGRDVNNAIVIDDPFASSEHAVLTFRGRSWYVEDLGSTNGTFVNGRPSRRSRRSASATRYRSARSACASSGPAPRDGPTRRPSPATPTRCRGSSGRSGRARAGPRPACWRWPPSRWSSAACRCAPASPGEFGLADPQGLVIYLAALASPTSPRSSPAGAPTRCCCPSSACSAGSPCCSWSACRRTS